MSSQESDNNINKELKCPKSPKQITLTNPKRPSFMSLMQVDEDSGSGSSQQDHSSTSKKLSKSNDEGDISNEKLNISNDRYEDSFDEEYGDQCETKPVSGDSKENGYENKDSEIFEEKEN